MGGFEQIETLLAGRVHQPHRYCSWPFLLQTISVPSSTISVALLFNLSLSPISVVAPFPRIDDHETFNHDKLALITFRWTFGNIRGVQSLNQGHSMVYVWLAYPNLCVGYTQKGDFCFATVLSFNLRNLYLLIFFDYWKQFNRRCSL